MPDLKLAEDTYRLAEQESVLDCLLRNNQSIAYSCKSGICQACLVKATAGTPSPKATAGLKSTLQASGYAMACQWIPDSDVEIKLPGADELAITVIIHGMGMLNPDVMRLLLTPVDADGMFGSCPGQYLSLISPRGITRSYSIANDFSEDGFIELHVGRTDRGAFTGWLFNDATVGQTLHARGPAGACYYMNPDHGDFPILLVGTNTGLAPLYGIMRDALRKQHTGPITLLHGGLHADRLYYVDELKEIERTHQNFHYKGVVLSGPVKDSAHIEGDIIETALASLDSATLPSLRVFLCGAPEFVHALRKKIFLKGARSAHLFCDAFVTRPITEMG